MKYLPHREVTRADKPSTKLRIVYIASAKTKNGVILNDCLYKGPYMSPMLYNLFLKFQIHRIAITADIEKSLFTDTSKETSHKFNTFFMV